MEGQVEIKDAMEIARLVESTPQVLEPDEARALLGIGRVHLLGAPELAELLWPGVEVIGELPEGMLEGTILLAGDWRVNFQRQVDALVAKPFSKIRCFELQEYRL